ncbi:lytic transglycosylase domain-containing protein [Aureimonas phyllosphaerae]|uniref:Soluble lytic murein transglycosylase n=1 Tax=Aureimonas phyllosphaerae TaxID=1166078 RepID=A0A7W6BPJ3_9HYPH|nr:lytic transglycosylase domain-containing protein [Aureimonas phyllosphaerae]MBB3934537.1 soluble lytic murein transglycosylase [Aureimonas phyllosphaerae]MBB3958247.1 soluble lytic murein transglycosylase [Aureimonas phyllosphaerae]SFE94179.1 soluble lytic murein transglycosylase [Aureimonas phyllosphaerae]
MTHSTRAKALIVPVLLSVLLTGTAPVNSFEMPRLGLPEMKMPKLFGRKEAEPDAGRFGTPQPAPSANPLVRRAPTPSAAGAAPSSPADAMAFTSSIAAMGARASSVTPMRGDLQTGLDATHRDIRRALAIREGMAPGSLDRHIMSWAIALRGTSDVPAAEIAHTAIELRGWPGMSTIRANLERALLRDPMPARDVVSAFASDRPQTPEGAMALAQAYLALGQAGKAKELIVHSWRNDRLDKALEQRMLTTFGTLLTRADHKYRMDKLLYADRVGDASRVATMAGAESLFKARAASIQGAGNADLLLAAVHPSLKSDPSYLFTAAENLRKKDRILEAAAILEKAPRDRASLVDGDAWWNERRIISRMLLEKGERKAAYRLVAAHSAEGVTEAVEAEFHSGWYALRYLNDPSTAAKHFARISQISSRPLTQSRAYYWMGRAAEAGGGGNARDLYARAARFGATYYGQLAAAKLGRSPGEISYPSPSAGERRAFENREAVQAIKRLESIGSAWRADSLYKALADELNSPGELAILASMAEKRGDHSLALGVGKAAYSRGVDAPALAFPVGVIPASANISASGKALAYAIARQESAFNPTAKSPVGALGLLQVMPATGRSLAKNAGLSYSDSKLQNDVSFNTLLGTQYLGQQISNFDGSYILTFAAYNAGPRRAREWIDRFGDPRRKSIDEVVDWVELIPFTETRNYVQRVMENYQVYKMRLGAGFDIERDLTLGRRS